jgi:hypothetical protein
LKKNVKSYAEKRHGTEASEPKSSMAPSGPKSLNGGTLSANCDDSAVKKSKHWLMRDRETLKGYRKGCGIAEG